MLVAILALAAGYVGAVYSWPAVRVWIVGAAAEVTALRRRAADLEARLKGLV